MPSLPPQTPQEFIESLQNEGVILAKQDKLYFIPLDILNKCKFPKAFENGTQGADPAYFSKSGAEPPNLVQDSLIFRNLNRVLSQFRVNDGISQAVWLGGVETREGKPVSPAAESKQVLFLYTDDKKKIVVDMTKGGRPSNR